VATFFRDKTRRCWVSVMTLPNGTRGTLRFPRAMDRQQALLLHEPRRRDEFMAQNGLTDPARKSQLGADLLETLKSFLLALSNKGDTPGHVEDLRRTLTSLFEASRWLRVGDMETTAVSEWVAGRRASGTATRGVARCIGAAKQFSRWLHHTGRTENDRLIILQRPQVIVGECLRRGALDEAAIEQLLEVTATAPALYGLSGAARALVYWICVETGLRRLEVFSLTPANLDFTPADPCIVLRGRSTKNRKVANLPVTRTLAAAIAEVAKGLVPDEPLIGHPPRRTADMLRRDLERAGLPLTDETGGQIDFHALRHTFGSRLARNGVHPKTAQLLMRHSRIELTLQTYTHLRLSDTRSAIEGLDRFHNIALDKAGAAG
jgi:integrase